MKKIYLESLGCARNQINSEVMLGKLLKGDTEITQTPAEADIIIVNTCSFIETAANESIDTILALAGYKKTGICRKLIVTGCLPERYREDTAKELPEVDLFLGTGAYDDIVEAVNNYDIQEKTKLPDPSTAKFQQNVSERVLTSAHLAYVKIAEGCNRHCSYCIIPKLRGKQRSRPNNEILDETNYLFNQGVNEILYVSESTTDYGHEQQEVAGLAKLLEASGKLADKRWIRLLYGHPASMTKNIIKTIHNTSAVCSYFDIPIQHASSRILKRMGREYSNDELYKLYDLIRQEAPGSAIRTTFITGFPGETDEDFQVLLKFIKDIRFDHVGVFTYSDSDDLPSHKLRNHVPHEIAQDRYNILMDAQSKISESVNRKHLNQIYRVLIEENPEEGLYLGRTFFQAPEVDGITFVYADNLTLGTFRDIKITDTYEYDITGEIHE